MREIISNPNMRAIADAQASILYANKPQQAAFRKGFYAALQAIHSTIDSATIEDPDEGGPTDGDVVDLIVNLTE